MNLHLETAATATALTTVDAVKAELSITGTDADTFLTKAIEIASAQICNELGLAMSDAGTVTLGRETVKETFRLNRGLPRHGQRDIRRRELLLSRWPVAFITTVVEAGNTLDEDDFEIDNETAMLLRLEADTPSFWSHGKIEVTYDCGFVLTGEGKNLPAEIESACIDLVKAAYFARGRDPALKSEVTTGVAQFDYFYTTPADGGLPASIAQKLTRWKLR